MKYACLCVIIKIIKNIILNFYIFIFNIIIIHRVCEEIFYKLYKEWESDLKIQEDAYIIYIYIYIYIEGDFL